jgi:hypothetical protein
MFVNVCLFAAVLLLSLLTFELTLLFMALIIVVFVITGVLSIIELHDEHHDTAIEQ